MRKQLVKKCCKITFEVILGLLAATVVLAGIVAWQVYSGNFNPKFLSAYLQETLLGKDSKVILDVEQIGLNWDHSLQTLVLEANNVSLYYPNQPPTAMVESINVQLSRTALLAFQLSPVRMVIEKPVLQLIRTRDNEVPLFNQVIGGNGNGGQAPVSGLFLSPAFIFQNSKNLEQFETLEIKDIQVSVEDRLAEKSWSVEDADIYLDRDGDEIDGQFSLDLLILEEMAHFDGIVSYDLVSNHAEVGIAFEKLSSERLERLYPRFFKYIPVKSKLSGRFISLFDFEDTNENIRSLLPRALRFDLSAEEGVIRTKELYERDVSFKSMSLRGIYRNRDHRFKVEEFNVNFDPHKLSVSAEVSEQEKGFDFNVNAEVNDLTVEHLKTFWPEKVQPKARRWIVENFIEGNVPSITFSAKANYQESVFSAERLDGTIRFNALETTYFRTFPKLEDLSGTATFDKDVMFVNIEQGGRVGGMDINQSSVKLFNLHEDVPDADIKLNLRGPLSNAIEIADRDPLYVRDNFDVDFDDFSAMTELNVRLQVPMLDVVPEDQFDASVTGTLTDLKADPLLENYRMTSGNLSLEIDTKALLLSGPAKINEIPVNLDVRQTFANLDQASMKLSATLDNKEREALDLPGARYIDGPVNTVFDINSLSETSWEVRGDIYLVNADVKSNPFGWTKPKGEPADIAFEAFFEGKKSGVLKNLTAVGPGLDVKMTGRLDNQNYYPLRLSLTKADINKTSVSGTYVRNNKDHTLSLKGPRLDLESLIDASTASRNDSEAKQDSGRIVLTGVFGQVTMGGIRDFTGADVKLTYKTDKNIIESLLFRAMTPNQKPFQATISRTPENVRVLKVDTNDAGGALKALNFFDNMIGGEMFVDGTYDDSTTPPVLTARADIENFRVVNAPVLTQLLNLASLTGFLDMLSGPGISFSDLIVRFTYGDDIVRVEDFKAYGSSLGIALEGNVDLRKEVTDLRGTIAPAYTLNKILGEIPLIGSILTGAGSEELFAARFSIRGKKEAPQITVNPLSVLTPGILRGIFSTDTDPIVREPEEESAGGKN